MSKIYELSLIFMDLNRNLNTVFYAVIAVSYGTEHFKVFRKISLFCYCQRGEKREKIAGHESDKLIESIKCATNYRAAGRVIFDYQAISNSKKIFYLFFL